MNKWIALAITGLVLSSPMISTTRAEGFTLAPTAEAFLMKRQIAADKETLSSLLDMIGKEDAAVKNALGGGELNYSGDRKYLIGRIYKTSLFGEKTTIGTIYEERNTVSAVTVHLNNPDASEYRAELVAIYGEPTKTESTPSESGFTYDEWLLPQGALRLYQGTNLAALEITKLPSHESTNWLPSSASYVKGEKEDNEAIREGIISSLSIPKDQLSSTSYFYNYVDLDGTGRKQVFALVVGPYTSGTGGHSAVWGTLINGKFCLKGDYTLFRGPILLVTEPNGTKSIIFRRSGGGAKPSLLKLSLVNGEYRVTEEDMSISKVKSLSGTVILSDFETAKGNSLAK